MYFIPFLTGIVTYIPGFNRYAGAKRTTEWLSARYCYSVWLRHLVMADNSRIPTQPDMIAELGPGASLGVGLAALLSGASRYYAFDVVAHADHQRNLQIFNGLVARFRRRERVPGSDEFPELKPDLPSYEFPSHILTERRLNGALRDGRGAAIKANTTYAVSVIGSGQLRRTRRPFSSRFIPLRLYKWYKIKRLDSPAGRDHEGDLQMSYVVPWYDQKVVKDNSVDMVFSQAVFEHVDDLEQIYLILYRWLKPGGFITNQIDFRSHGTAKAWNGHWAYSDVAWKIIRGRNGYLSFESPASLGAYRSAEEERV